MSLKEEMIQGIVDACRSVIERDDDDRSKLESVCSILKDRVQHYDWVGFYIVEGDDQLVLGPYVGDPTDHTRIGFGEGICGQAADTGKLFLIQDVSKETNYLSCSPSVRSEIVLPIFRGDELVGELDIDSHLLHPFTDLDTRMLEMICELTAPLL